MNFQAKSARPFERLRRHLLVLLAGVGLLSSGDDALAQGSGSPQLSQAVNLKTGQNGPSSVVLADVNGDGILDMVVANEYGGGPNGDSLVSVFLGNGDGTFQSPVNYDSGGTGAVSVYVANVKGDGYPDIFVLNQMGEANGDASVGVLTNDKNANGTFNNAGQMPTTIYDAGGTDPNSNSQVNLVNTVLVMTINGTPAIVVSNQLDPSNSNGDGSIGVLLQNAQGEFGPVITYDSGGVGTNVVAVGDVNGDGLPDIVVANSCYSAITCPTQQGGVAVLVNNGGTFGPAVSYETSGFALAVAVGDLNGDGIPDILVSSAGTGEFINNGDGTFQSFESLGNPGQTVSAAVQDVNGDGINDLVIGLYDCATCNGSDSGIAVALGNANSATGKADGTFGPWQTYDTAGQGVFGLAFGHLIGGETAAGTPDIVTANICDLTDPYCGGNVAVFLNNNAAIALTSSLAGPATPPVVNTPVNFTFAVNNPGNLALGSGTIALYDGTTQVASQSVPPFQGSSSFTFTWTPASGGMHNLVAVYSANGGLNPSGVAVASESSTAFLQQNVAVPRTLVSIAVTPANATIVSGAIQEFDALGTYSDGTTSDVTTTASWSTSSGTVAAINGPGIVLGVGPGQTPVAATAAGIAGSAGITVTAPTTVPVSAPVAYYSTASIGFGGAAAGSTQTIALINAGENALTLNSASITSGSANFSVALTSCPNNAASFPVTIPAGQACVFTITYVAATTVPGAITFTDNASLSNVSSSGSGSTFTQVVPVNPTQAGDASAAPEPIVDQETIVVNDEVFVTPLVSVASPVAEYSFSTLGFSGQSTQVLTVSNIGQQNLVLSSVTVSGSAFILSSTSCSTGATSPTSVTLPPGGTCYLTFTYSASNGPPSGFVTFLDNANLSNVNSVSAGSGSYTQTMNLSGSASISTPIPPAVLAISITPGTATIAPGSAQQFTAKGTFSDGTAGDVTSSVTWSSSSTGVATISNQAGTQGLASAVSAGTTNISATSGYITATAVLNVSLAVSEPISVDDVVTVGASPLITSASSTSFMAGTQGAFAVTAVGTPAPTISESGQLPAGVTFSSGALSGTPAAGSVGMYPITITAINSTNPSASQSFTLNVTGTPAVTFTGSPTSAIYGSTVSLTATTNAGVLPTITGTAGVCSVASVTGTPGATTAQVNINSGTGTCVVSANWIAANDYQAATASLTITAQKASPTVVFSGAPASAAFESTFKVIATTTASTAAVISASGPCAISRAIVTMTKSSGVCILAASWPADNNYLSATATQSSTAITATPRITWAKPAAIAYPTPLSSTQLDATASVSGTLTYTPAAGAVLDAGTPGLTVNFVPTDATDYTTATYTTMITVNRASSGLAWATPAPISYGMPLSGTQLDATAAVAGKFVYTPQAGAVVAGGMAQPLKVTFTPTNADYATATLTVPLQVNATTPDVAWSAPASISYGTKLNATQLNAKLTNPYNSLLAVGGTSSYTEAPSGSTTFSSASGAYLPVGSYQLQFAFTPSNSNSANYTAASATNTVTVVQAASTTAITGHTPNPASVSTGPAVAVSYSVKPTVALATGSGLVGPTGGAASVTVAASTGESCTGSLSGGAGSCTLTFTTTGSRTLKATYAGDANFNGSTSAAVTQKVN